MPSKSVPSLQNLAARKMVLPTRAHAANVDNPLLLWVLSWQGLRICNLPDSVKETLSGALKMHVSLPMLYRQLSAAKKAHDYAQQIHLHRVTCERNHFSSAFIDMRARKAEIALVEKAIDLKKATLCPN